MTPIRVRVRATSQAYEVLVAPGLLARAGSLLRRTHDGSMAAVVTDRTVDRLHGARLVRSLQDAGWTVRRDLLPDGERAKSLAMLERLWARWARTGLPRDAIVVALGGGVVSDVAGFAAACYARGLPWAAFPTTVIGQADAAIGGKTGVNLALGKNLVGAFHHPVAVFSDVDTLRTLPPRAYRAGLAEIAKIGVIARPALLARLERLARAGTRTARPSLVAPLVRSAAEAKAVVVEADERDQGARLALNFGHTVGHALEAATAYRRYLHGEAVAIGMAAALRMSVLEAGLDPVDAMDAESLLQALGLPTRLRREPGREFWMALARDKKRGRSGVRMVLCPAIGESKVFELPALTTLRRVVSSLVRHPGGNP
jgi:3-dehydroquinate synthase